MLTTDDPPEQIDLPEEIRSIGVNWASVIDRGDGEPVHVWVEFGGGFHHYGLLIGSPGFVHEPYSGERVSQWSDRVWFRTEHAPLRTA